MAEALVREHGADACRRQAEWLPLRKARDRPALLVRAIQQQWAAPAALDDPAAEQRHKGLARPPPGRDFVPPARTADGRLDLGAVQRQAQPAPGPQALGELLPEAGEEA